jgi:hypothetical protein
MTNPDMLDSIPMPSTALWTISAISAFIGRGIDSSSDSSVTWGPAEGPEDWCYLTWSDSGIAITISMPFWRANPTAYYAVAGYALGKSFTLLEPER